MEKESRKELVPSPDESAYDPPKVEQVIGADELAREVHYAGVQISPGQIA